MQVKSIAECSKGSILQYFLPSLCSHLSLRSLFCLFLSGCFTQVSLYYDTVPEQASLNEKIWPTDLIIVVGAFKAAFNIFQSVF